MPPTSTVAALPSSSPSTFSVHWSGTDDLGGSGNAFFDIYVSDNGGPFTRWLAQTTQTSASFTGLNGHHYGFYSVATDHAGNREATPTGAQATTDVRASIVTWRNPAGGDWDDAANWDLRVPTADDDVVINMTGITINHAAARADAVHSLTTQAAINLSGGSLSIAAPSVLNALFTVSDGMLQTHPRTGWGCRPGRALGPAPAHSPR